jgi:hypothetical protein
MDHGIVTCYHQVTTVPFSTFVPLYREEGIVGVSIFSSSALREGLIADNYSGYCKTTLSVLYTR